ncbi:MAG: ATP-binding protein [Phototrophicaceae bacterium]
MNLKMGLGTRLNLIIIAVNIMILSGVAYLANASSATVLRTDAVTRFNDKSLAAFQQVNTDLLTFEALTQSVADEIIALDSLSTSAVINETIVTLLQDVDNIQFIESISILRPDGTVIWVNADQVNETVPQLRVISAGDALDTPQFLSIAESTTPTWFLQDNALFSLTSRNTITVALPYEASEGNGIVWVDILQSDFRSLLLDALNTVGLLLDTSTGYVLVIDDMGEVIDIENINDNFVDLNLTVDSLKRRIVAADLNQEGLYAIDDPFNSNAESLVQSQIFSANNWQFVSVLPVGEIPVIPVNVYIPILIVGTVGIIVLIYLVNRFIGTSMMMPISDLERSATEMGEGNLRFIVFHQDQQNEIGRLARAMDSMRNRLRDSYDELQAWSYTLEERVTNRTVQLGEAQMEAEHTAQQLQAVYDESLSVVNEAQLQPVLDTFIDRILTLLDASYCAVWLLENDRINVRLVATNDTRRRITTGDVTMDARDGLVGQAIRLNQPIIVNDYAHYEHRARLDAYYYEDELAFHRGVCAPLKFAGANIGAVIVGRKADSAPFDIESQRQLTLFANMVSPSVRNAQLFIELQQAVNEAKKANEVKTRFLASVTHELRTPLNLIINNIDFMRVGTFGDVNEEQVSRLNQTVRSAEHLLYLINDLLDVSKIEAGEMQLFIQQQELYTMLEDAVDNAYAMLDTYDDKADLIELRVDIDDDLPEIPMDSRRIRQVLNNLLSNGIKFTKKGAVSIKVFASDEGVHFSVHDTGMGIPQEEMPKLFAAFQRTNSATQQAIEGTGLGLPISQYMVQQHGSDLMVTSEEGLGTTFAFTLPLNTPITTLKDLTDTQQITAILSKQDE